MPHEVAADEDELGGGALDRLLLEDLHEVAARRQRSPLAGAICSLEPGPEACPELRNARGVVVHAALRIIDSPEGPSSPVRGTARGGLGPAQSTTLRAASSTTRPARESLHGLRRWIRSQGMCQQWSQRHSIQAAGTPPRVRSSWSDWPVSRR